MCPLPRLFVSDGTIEAMKWLALLSMTGDHVNKCLFNGTLPFLFEIGRLAMPLFIFVLAYKLARPGIYENGAYLRIMTRLTIFGLHVIAILVFLIGGTSVEFWWPAVLLPYTPVHALVDPHSQKIKPDEPLFMWAFLCVSKI
jgi:hypothetical protein